MEVDHGRQQEFAKHEKLDDSWNAQDLETFRRYHVKDYIVRWPNQPPTHGIDAHEQEAVAFFKMFPDQHLINDPHKIMLAQGEWTCTVADFRGPMEGPMTTPDGTDMGNRELSHESKVLIRDTGLDV